MCCFQDDEDDIERDGQPLLEETATSAGLDGVSTAPTKQTADRKPDQAIDDFKPVTYNYRCVKM